MGKLWDEKLAMWYRACCWDSDETEYVDRNEFLTSERQKISTR